VLKQLNQSICRLSHRLTLRMDQNMYWVGAFILQGEGPWTILEGISRSILKFSEYPAKHQPSLFVRWQHKRCGLSLSVQQQLVFRSHAVLLRSVYSLRQVIVTKESYQSSSFVCIDRSLFVQFDGPPYIDSECIGLHRGFCHWRAIAASEQ